MGHRCAGVRFGYHGSMLARHFRLSLVSFAALTVALAACGDDPDRGDGTTSVGGQAGAGASSGATGGTGTGTSTGGTGASSTGGSGGTGGITTCGNPEEHSGEATYYDFADGSGNCSFDPSPNDLMIGAMNHTDYADSAACGACVELTGPNATILIRVVDRCPECPAGDIDLSPEAFAHIAALSDGRVPITWHYAECNVSGPIQYKFKEGSNQWWTAVQLRNHRHAILSFEYDSGGGNWVDVGRLDYNYFVEDSGMGPGPYSFRVTDVYGNTLEDHGIGFIEGGVVDGAAQFPPCGD